MPKKIKDFFIKDIFGSAGFEANEIEFLNAASDITEVEISDELVNKYHSNMLSREAAMNDPDISKKFKSNLWGNFTGLLDTRLKKFNDLLTEEQQITVKEIEATPDKLEKIIEFIKAKKPTKEEDSEIQKKYDGLLIKHTNQQTKYEGDISNLNDTHKLELDKKEIDFKDFQINNVIKSSINDYALIDNIPGGKNYLADSIVNNLRKSSKFTLELNDSGIVDLKQKDDPTMKYFDGGKEVTLKQVLEPELKDWIKNSPGAAQRKSDPITPQTPDRPLSFQEVQAAKAKQNLVDAAAEIAE